MADQGFTDAPLSPPERQTVNLQGLVTKAAMDANLDPAFVHRLIKTESNWNPQARSNKGALGLMQVLPTTGQRYGVTDLLNPTENVKAGIAYLKDLHQRYGGRQDLVAAAYNAGEGAVDKAGGVPKFAETQAYVNKVAGGGATFTDAPLSTKAVQSSGVPPARPMEEMGPRARGGYNITDEPRSLLGPTTVRGVIGEMTHLSPEQQAAMDVIQLGGGLVGAGRSGVRPGEVGPRPSLPTRWIGAAREAIADQPLVKGIAKRLGYDPDAMELQSERLQTQAVRMRLEAARSRARQAAAQGSQPSVPAAPGYEQFLPNRSGFVPGEPAAPQGPMPTATVIERYAPNVSGIGPSSAAVPSTTPPARSPTPRPSLRISDARMDELVRQLGGRGPAVEQDPAWVNQQRSGNMTWQMGGGTPTELSYEAAETEGVRPAAVSPATIQRAASSSLGKLSAEETSQGMQWRRQGVSDAEIVQRLQDLRAFKARYGTSSGTEVKAEFQRQAESGKKSLLPRYGSKKIGRFDVVEE